MKSRFVVGENIIFDTGDIKYIGLCTEVTPTTLFVRFSKDSSFYQRYYIEHTRFLFSMGYILYPEKTLSVSTREERVLDKCKKLWNDIKYAKKHNVQY